MKSPARPHRDAAWKSPVPAAHRRAAIAILLLLVVGRWGMFTGSLRPAAPGARRNGAAGGTLRSDNVRRLRWLSAKRK
jgi:hypothetical protein